MEKIKRERALPVCPQRKISSRIYVDRQLLLKTPPEEGSYLLCPGEAVQGSLTISVWPGVLGGSKE